MSEAKKLTEFVHIHRYQHLVFDLDETITRLQLPWPEGFEMLYDRAPQHVEKQLRQDFGQGEPFGIVLNKAVEDHEEFLPILLAWAHDFEDQLASQQANDELVALLPQFVAEGRRLILWTSNTRKSALLVLRQLGIAELFETIVSRDDVRLIKPDPEGWQHIYGGQELSSYLFIGDSVNDRSAAEAIGIDYFEITHFK